LEEGCISIIWIYLFFLSLYFIPQTVSALLMMRCMPTCLAFCSKNTVTRDRQGRTKALQTDVCNKTVDRIMTFRYLEASITSDRNLEKDASTNDQSSYDAWLPTRYNLKKRVHEFKKEDKDVHNLCKTCNDLCH